MDNNENDEPKPTTSWLGTFSTRQLLAFQLRLALALAVIIPFVGEIQRYWDRLVPSAYTWIAITFILPVLALIFLVNQKTLLWITSLALLTVGGGGIGFFAGRFAFPNAKFDVHMSAAAISAILTWATAVRIRSRRTNRKSTTGPAG